MKISSIKKVKENPDIYEVTYIENISTIVKHLKLNEEFKVY